MPSSSLLLTFTKMPWLSAPLFLAPLPMPPTLLPVAFGHPKRTYITMLLLPVAYVINHTLSWASTPHLHWIPPLSLPTICPKDCFYFFFFFFPYQELSSDIRTARALDSFYICAVILFIIYCIFQPSYWKVENCRVLADGHIPWACEAFSQFHGQELVQNPALLW